MSLLQIHWQGFTKGVKKKKPEGNTASWERSINAAGTYVHISNLLLLIFNSTTPPPNKQKKVQVWQNLKHCFLPTHSVACLQWSSALCSQFVYARYMNYVYCSQSHQLSRLDLFLSHILQVSAFIFVYTIKYSSVPSPLYPSLTHTPNLRLMRCWGDTKNVWADHYSSHGALYVFHMYFQTRSGLCDRALA